MRNGNRRAWQGDVCVRTLAARTRHPVARAMLVFLITIAMTWPVGIAYGVVITQLPDSELLWGVSYPETDYPQLKFYTNYGSSRYEALGEMLAGEGGSSAWPVLTADQRAYLSNPETGGDFYLLAQELHAFDDIDDVTDALEVPTPIYWWVVNVGLYTVQTGQWQNPEWLHNLWYMDTTQQNIDDAIQAVEDILSGDVPGGGGGNTDYYEFSGNVYFVNYQYTDSNYITNKGYTPTVYYTRNPNSNRTLLGNTLTIRIPKTVLTGFESVYPSSDGKWIAFISWTNGNIYTLEICKYDNKYMSSNTMINNFSYISSFNTGTYTTSALLNSNSKSSFTFDGETLTLPDTATFTIRTITANSQYNSSYTAMFVELSDGDPTVPPTNWPDPTPTPVPPTSPTVPVAPIINNTNNYTNNTYNTTNVDTSGDVTALLQKILQALDTHCVHLQNTIADELEINAKWITDTLDNDFGLLLQYLEDLADWLKANWDFDYDVAPYDDSSILYWLRRIYNTLRTGGNTRPADPVTDPNGTGDWLQQLWQKFIDWMFGNAPLAVNELLSIFDVLRRKFPFSVPWDMAAVLTALVHEPVVPVIQLPCYAVTVSGGIQQVGTYTISLQAYDTAWGGVRTVLFVVFAFELMKRSRSLLDLLKIGGN